MDAKSKNMAFSIFAVTIVMAASMCCAFCTLHNEEQDDDILVMTLIYAPEFIGMTEAASTAGATAAAGAVGLSTGGVALLVVGAFALGLVIGYGAGYSVAQHHYEKIISEMENEGRQIARLNEANMANIRISDASGFTVNALKNYAQIWNLSEEHWTRQAEMSAFSLWDEGRGYSASEVLERSGIYSNDSIMLANATVQMNLLLDMVCGRSAEWHTENTESTYGSLMEMSFGFSDGYSVESKTGNLKGEFLTATDGSEGYVYLRTNLLDTAGYIEGESEYVNYVPGYLYVMSNSATLTDAEGHVHTYSKGRHDISSLDSGIYRVSGAPIMSDALSKAIGTYGAIDVYTGIRMESDDGSHYAYYRDGNIYVDGRSTSSVLTFSTIANDIRDCDSNMSPVDLTNILVQYDALIKQMNTSAANASNSAQALWEIYDEVREKNMWATTLSCVSNYEDSVLSSQMKKAMTVSAMKQLSSYYKAHGDKLENLEFTLLDDTTDRVPLVRGSIYDSNGNPIYTDVLFSPFFQTSDAVMNDGERTAIGNYATAMVWTASSSFNDWVTRNDQGTDEVKITQNGEMIALEDGDYFTVDELGYLSSDGIHHVDSLAMSVKQIRYIDGEEIVDPPMPVPPEPLPAETDWMMVAIVFIAILVAAYGLYSGRPGFVALAFLMVTGYFAYSYFKNELENILPWRWF